MKTNVCCFALNIIWFMFERNVDVSTVTVSVNPKVGSNITLLWSQFFTFFTTTLPTLLPTLDIFLFPDSSSAKFVATQLETEIDLRLSHSIIKWYFQISIWIQGVHLVRINDGAISWPVIGQLSSNLHSYWLIVSTLASLTFGWGSFSLSP